MIYIIVAVGIIAVAAIIRFYLLKKELKRIHQQLYTYNQGLTGKKVDLRLFEPDLEQLAGEINNLMDSVADAQALRRRTEFELKESISHISHDLRTPLTSILGYIQLLESDQVTEEEKTEYVAIAKGRTKRLQALLSEFFELSVIESTDYELKSDKVHMNVLIPEILLGYYDRFNERSAEAEADIQLDEEKILIAADESAVKRVVENLITNALNHSEGPICIRMEKRQSTVVLSIRNQANHLKHSDLHSLFDRFYTADRSRSGTGTGLGLAIAKSLMVKMNGELTAELLGNQFVMHCVWRLDRGSC